MIIPFRRRGLSLDAYEALVRHGIPVEEDIASPLRSSERADSGERKDTEPEIATPIAPS